MRMRICFTTRTRHQTSLFGGGVGRVIQDIDTNDMTLTSDCIVKASVGIPFVGFAPIFSGFGSVISKANIIGGEEANDKLYCGWRARRFDRTIRR